MILLDGSHLSLSDLLSIADDRAEVGLAPGARTRVAAARAVVDRKAAGEDAVYGVNTGFGNFAETRIDRHDLAALQLNLLRSHAAGVDAPLPVRTVRAAMALRANVLAKGFSGIRVATLEALLALLNSGVHPRVPRRRHQRRALDRCADGVDASVRAARASAAAVRRPGDLGRQPVAAARRQRHQCLSCELRPRAGRVFDALRAASTRRGARSAQLDSPHRHNRNERRD